ncbi:kanadaptin [Uranotaenia lowii]|uniref:kanadaptin n=1 Tax=Uranotaenia lowii TaxID=190385 RepID=UPI00247ADE16|nr:kanadaptin [Uranotaenia lowii]
MTEEENTFKKPVDLKVIGKLRKPFLPARSDVEIPSQSSSSEHLVQAFVLAEADHKLSSDNNEIPPIPYREPSWSRKCDSDLNYSFEVLKNGVIIEEVKQLQNKPYWLFGRLPNCDINMAHPTISRYHAILQYRYVPEPEENSDSEENSSPSHVTLESGWYLYDLNSTHGTFLNKQRLQPKTYVRVRVGYMIKLGSSSRSYILQGPAEDEDEPSTLTITEMKEMRQNQEKLRLEMAEIERQENERVAKLKEEDGITWGMGEDADEETDLTHNPYAVSNNEELFLDDPKKTLRGYFEREGHELEYKLDELSAGSYVCKVELPVDDDYGRPIIAEVSHKGKKKEAVVQCALEACRILDRYGLLRQATHEPRRRHKKTSDSDDDDDFLDRTGDIERRRQRKQAKAGAGQVHTYEDLIRQESELLERLEQIEAKIHKHQMIDKGTCLPENDDDVDDFLTKLSDDKPFDKFEVRRLRLEKERLTKDHVTLQRLIKIAKPFDLPGMSKTDRTGESSKEELKKRMMPLFGKRNKLSSAFGIKKSEVRVGGSTSANTDEIERDDNEDQPKKAGEELKKEAPEVKQTTQTPESKKAESPSFSPELLEKHYNKTIDNEKPQTASKCQEQNMIIESPTAAPERKRKSDAVVADDCVNDDERLAATSKSSKKRVRQRARDRNTRDNVDIDDSEELQSEEKNIDWVPPQNQSGDGMTALNEKYGY